MVFRCWPLNLSPVNTLQLFTFSIFHIPTTPLSYACRTASHEANWHPSFRVAAVVDKKFIVQKFPKSGCWFAESTNWYWMISWINARLFSSCKHRQKLPLKSFKTFCSILCFFLDLRWLRTRIQSMVCSDLLLGNSFVHLPVISQLWPHILHRCLTLSHASWSIIAENSEGCDFEVLLAQLSWVYIVPVHGFPSCPQWYFATLFLLFAQ